MLKRILLPLLLVAAACSGSDSENTTTTLEAPAATEATEESTVPAADNQDTAPEEEAEPEDEAPPAPEDLPVLGDESELGPDVRLASFGEQDPDARIVVAVEPGDVSFLAFALAESPADEVAVTRITAPGGEVLYELDFASFERGGPAFGDAPLSDFGEASVFYPPGPDFELAPGEYIVEFFTDGAFLADTGAIIRSGDVDSTQAIDVRFWMATTSPDLADEGVRQDLADEMRSIGDDLLAPHGMSVGTLEFIDPPADVVDRYSTLVLGENDEAQRDLCGEMSLALPNQRALNFAIVDTITADDDEGGVIEGNAAGLPGLVLVPGARTSCVTMISEVDEFDGRDIFDRAVVVWHEGAHLMGLPHTTEAEGDTFDFFDDTPECFVDAFDEDGSGDVDSFECETADGGNFMFYDSDGTDLSPDQAWMLRRHPLFVPVA
jgi:hypothetical protein